jgi:L-malate glycosyltransferase
VSERLVRLGLVCHAGIGGSARVAVELASGLADRGHRVHLFSRTPPLGAGSFHRGVSFHGLGGSDSQALSSRLDAAWSPADEELFLELIESVSEAARLEVLHFHYAVPFAPLACRLRSRMGPISPRLLMTLHGTDVSRFGFDRFRGPGLAAAVGGMDALTTVSRSHALLAQGAFELAGPPRVISNFVDLRRFRPRRLRSSSGPPRVIHVSNFRAVKQPEALARIFVRVRRHADARLWLVGDGERMSAARSILVSSGVEGDVSYLGLRPDVHRILPFADLLLVTSRTESFCLAALEAAACGLPVVAPRVGGLPEVVLDGTTGLLFEPGDEAGATAAVLELLADGQRRAAMGQAARAHARRFSHRRVLRQYESMYRELAASRSEAGTMVARDRTVLAPTA